MPVVKFKKKMRTQTKLIIVLAMLLVFTLLFCYWFNKAFRIHPDTDVKVVIIGDSERYTEQQIKDFVLDSWYENYSPLIKFYYKFHDVEPPMYLEKITVSVKEGIVTLKAYEKVPIGCLLEMGNYLYFDSDGMIVSSQEENKEGLPVVKGLEYSSVTLGKVFETQKPELFHLIMSLVKQLDKCAVVTDTITFGTENSVTLNCAGNIIELGEREMYDVQIEVLKGILDEILGGDVKYRIDLTNVIKGNENVTSTIIE